MRLYDFPYSPNCRKVRAVAYELGVELDYVRIDLVRRENCEPAYLAMNPNGRVPVLEDGEFVLWESNAILAYLATKYPEPLDLLPKDARGRAEVDRWLSWQLAHLAPATSKVAFERIVKKLTGQGTPDEAAIRLGAAEFATHSKVLDGWLGKREYVADTLSIADFALASHYSIAPACGLDLTPFPNVGSWAERMIARPSFRRALADAQRM
jgi:glutathione S-transferase